jgi:endoglucanase
MNLLRRIITILMCVSLIFVTASCTSETKPGESTRPTNTTGEANALPAAGTRTADSQKISEDILVDQIGYKTDDKKIAVIKGTGKTFKVIDRATGKVVLSKETDGKVNDESSGDTVSYADFSEMRIKGTYYISVDGLGKSCNFKVGDNTLFSEVNSAMAKALYFQRCGIALEPKYAGEYIHASCHTGKAMLYGNEVVEMDVSGGWHDAGDYGRYVVPAAVTAADLMLAYEFYPESFINNYNIPESFNNIPDVLDEVRYGITWMFKMQDKQTGGVYHKVTSRNFPDLAAMPDTDVDDLLVMPVSTTATADFAAVTAMASRIYKNIDAAFSEQCLIASLKAWKWLETNSDFIEYRNPQDVSSGEYGDSSGRDETS